MTRTRRLLIVLLTVMVGMGLVPVVSIINLQIAKAASVTAQNKASDELKIEVAEYQEGMQSGEQMYTDIIGIINNYNLSDIMSIEEFEASYDAYVLSKSKYLEAMGSCINALNDTINIFGQLENAPYNPNYTVQDMETDLQKLRDDFDDFSKMNNMSADSFLGLFGEICEKLKLHYPNMQTGCDNYKAPLDDGYLASQYAREAYLKSAEAIVTTAMIEEEGNNQQNQMFDTGDIRKVSVSVETQTFTGKALKPKVTVKTSVGRELKINRDYTVDYSNNIYPGVGTVTIKGQGNYTGSKTASFRIQFSDVIDPNSFWYTPVYWAYDNHITTGFLVNGKSDGTFRPWNTCNRAAVVTFLWRLAGSPPPKAMASFKDMTGNGDFDKAISWAKEEGIVTGWSDNTFRPWQPCNRAAIVTFIWRYAGEPYAGPRAMFKDMTWNSDFDKAISWGSANGILTGYIDNTFRPWNDCNRAATVTFLYRYNNKIN